MTEARFDDLDCELSEAVPELGHALLLSTTMFFSGLVRSLCFGVYSAVIGYANT